MDPNIYATRCREYDLKTIREQIAKHLDVQKTFSDISGKRVLIKINLLSASVPERGVTTHPTFVEGLALELIDRGAYVIIGDSPGGLFNRKALELAYERSGMRSIAKKHNVKLNYNTKSHIEKLPDGSMVKSFNICDFIRKPDLIIAAPKIKTHMFAGLTCCSKIMFGSVPGMEKVSYHTRFPDMDDFSRMLLDLTDLVKPDLFLVDGIIGMDKKGPSWGRLRDIGVIVSGTDNRLLDLFISRMVGLDPKSLPITRQILSDLEFDPYDVIEPKGEASDFRLKEQFAPATGVPLATDPPKFIRRLLIHLTTGKPKIDKKKCVGCGVCRDNCAGSAIDIINGKARIDYSKCIRCYCCHELCPHDAVKISSFSRFIPGIFKG